MAVNVQPTNEIGVAETTLNRTRGTAQLTVAVPNPGLLEVVRTRRIRKWSAPTTEAGEVRVPIRLRAAAARRLDRRGKLGVAPRLRFTPTDGRPYSMTHAVALIKR